MKKLYIILILLLVSHYSISQEHFVEGLNGDDIAYGNTINLEDQYFKCSSSSAINCPYPFEIEFTKLYTKLYFDDALRNYYGADWSIEIEYNIKLYTYVSGTTVSQIFSGKKLTINYHPTNNYKDIALEIFPISGDQFTKAEVEITDIIILDNNTSTTAQINNRIPDDVHFDLNLEVNRIYTLNPNQRPRVNSVGTFSNATNEYTISWDFLPGAAEYDVEWLFVDIGNNTQTDNFEIDFRNATRITTEQHFYKISMAYPRGFLIYRIRAIGYEEATINSGIYNRRVEGAWSFNQRGLYKQNGVDLIPRSGNTSGNSRYCNTFYFWNGLETNKNWQYNVVYAEDGKRKEVINFYDGILKPTQTATILNTDESAVIAQPIYDFIGRTSLQVLPAPQKSQGIRYYKPLHKNSAGLDYSYKDFDLDPIRGNQTTPQSPNIVEPDKLSPNGNLGAGYYYSTQNTNSQGINSPYIPDAKGYPYSRTIYKNDGSGRVKAVSGVGKEYFGNNGAMQHETKFLYGSPFQEELFMLFGNNVGFAEYYEKTVAIDANGQASAAIKDLSGRVIATSLAGDEPDNLLAIDTKPDKPITLKVHLNDLNEISEESLIVNKTLIAIGTTTYNFSYEIDQALFNNCGVNAQCAYDLEIYLLDEYGSRQKLKYKGTLVDEIKKEAITGTSLDGMPYEFSTKKVSTGSYQLVKKLTLNQEAVDKAVIKWKENQTCIPKRIIDPITSCNPDCESLCEESFMTAKDRDGVQYYITETGVHVAKVENDVVTTVIDQQEYTRIQGEIVACKDQCEAYDPTEPLMSECELKLTLLKQDMSPGGQYFDNLPDMYQPAPDVNTLNTSYDENGWLNTISDQEFYRLKDCFGSDEGKREGLFNELRKNWKPEYADILVSLHPEWCAYKTLCCGKAICDIQGEGDENVNRTNGNPSDDPSHSDCDPLTPADQTQINTWLTNTDFKKQSQDALIELGPNADASTRAEFTPQKLEDRARKFYEEYLKYQKVKSECSGLYLKSTDDSGFTSDGFAIRYPENFVFENLDPDHPENSENEFSCEKQAEEAADTFINKLKSKCDLATPSQEDELRKFVYNQYLEDCKDPAVTVDINEAIREYIRCSSQLPEACFLEALPEQTDESCACAKINNFVVDVNQSIDPNRTYEDIVSDANAANSQEIQDALDLVLDTTELGLKPNFSDWYKSCNKKPLYSWTGGNPSTPYELAKYFSCNETEKEEDPDTDCVTVINAYAQAIADAEFERLLNQKAEEYRQAYIAGCLAKAQYSEKFEMDYEYNEYHYTLYYYDQAGDLVATVPPDGIFQKDLKSGAVVHDSRILKPAIHQKAMEYLKDPDNNPFVHTQHLMVTNYQYNSLQNVITQKTPDGGISNFWYDALGRMAVSQNANQLTRKAYSYLQYDALGRTIEAGELLSPTPMDKVTAEDINDYNNPVANGGANLLLKWLDGKKRNERTLSFYDEVNTAIIPNNHPAYQSQNNLRNRISAVVYDNTGDSYDDSTNTPPSQREIPLKYDALTHYTYDVLGNVETLWQENRAIPGAFAQHRVKRLDYTYDLVSGNVNQVSYQKDKEDQLMHRYSYDADNRLVKVRTSVDDMIWETEARYFYYAHGPLAREEIGDKIVFANDYIYDIRGWITAMNSSMVDAKRDAGKDGMKGGLNENIGRDPFAFSLHYYKDHYQPISSSSNNVIARNFDAIDILNPNDSRDLYNGNIAKMVTSLKNLAQEPIEVMANAYRYDQLNRIKSSKPYWDKGSNKPLNDNAFTTDNARNESEFYNANYWFDGNGNIERLQRNSITSAYLSNEKMDDMTYGYNKVNSPVPKTTANVLTANAKVNNQLFEVEDAITTAGYDIDIESGQTANNYTYDEIGRLVQDRQENIKTINWNVSNKVTSFIQTDKDADVVFYYGPLGNRIGKLVKSKDQNTGIYDPTKDTETYYMLDAQGNPIAIYKYNTNTGKLTLEDFILYGNKRLGTNTQNKTMN
ncbi:RHS repeat protein [Marixanthomonas ophiurae]|uniref:RHS repeat protein n=2 Tax=Marixanthomonas ophiurae TaxID=387659 RepID=A0A3E1Q9J8_9FLAO|nr:RHS repeat protein [Marixanthomonas ophiurae]